MYERLYNINGKEDEEDIKAIENEPIHVESEKEYDNIASCNTMKKLYMQRNYH